MKCSLLLHHYSGKKQNQSYFEMGTFDLTSTLEPTDEQLMALMKGIGERGRRSTQNMHEVHARLLKQAIESVRNGKK